MRLWYRDPLQRAVLGIFVGTLTFALALLRGVGPRSVPDVGVTVAALAVTVSVVLFLTYLDRFVHSVRPVAVAWAVAGAGARVFRAGHPAAPDAADVVLDDAPAFTVGNAAAGVIQAVDRVGLVAEAARHDCLIVIPHAVGDLVPHGDDLIEVHGHGSLPSAERLRGMVALGEERTIEQDVAFALRILVDIAIRALSPAVNDPTTAVQVLGALEDLLLLIGESDLEGRGTLRDAQGDPRVLIAARRWDDLLDLALTEIRDYGAASTQVTRRVRALLESLDRRVRPEHRAAVAEQLAALDEAVAGGAGDALSRALAAQPDRQGIGGPSADAPDVIPSVVARARARSVEMCVAAEVSGAARTSPIIPNRLPPAIVTISTASGWMPSAAPNAIGWIICCRMPLASSTTTAMISAVDEPCEPSASSTVNAPADHAPR